MGEGEYRSGTPAIRRMREEDIDAADAVAESVLGHFRPATDEELRRQRSRLRFEHYLRHDAAGSWVAGADGGVIGVANAILREGIWCLGLLAVAADLQARGIGKRLLDASLTYGDGARGGFIMSSEDPKAMRRYARAGFDLLPGVSAAGVLGPVEMPEGIDEPPRDEAVARAAPLSRAARGASHGEDLGLLLDGEGRMLLLGDRGYVIFDDRSVRVLAARDAEAAATVLRASFAALPRGASMQVDHLRAGQDWAIAACLDAGLALSPSGPTFVRGEVGPLTHYIPSGAYL
jgi:predicted N-acetyltransferase YhbS